jgi:hypothetical protein
MTADVRTDVRDARLSVKLHAANPLGLQRCFDRHRTTDGVTR